LLVSSGGTGGHHRLSASPDRAGKPFAVLRLLPERRGDGIQDRDALGVGRLLGGEVSTRPLRAETKADAAVHASRGWEGEPGGRVGPQLIYAILCGVGEGVGGHASFQGVTGRGRTALGII